jgi:hypothetical protein
MLNFSECIAKWAAGERSVRAVALIGSRARAPEDVVWRADAQSDWDFHVITSDPELFSNPAWTAGLGARLQHYSVRRSAIGSVPKVGAIFDGAEADFVVIPLAKFRAARRHVRLKTAPPPAEVVQVMRDLALIVRPGWRFLKDVSGWDDFYRAAVNAVADRRMSDDDARMLANGFVFDARWTERKIERGELLAAQRMLHRSLAETNFQLLHELRLRRGERSFPEARRAEIVLGAAELAAVTTSARAEAAELRAALEKSAATCRELMRVLVGDAWRWPEL